MPRRKKPAEATEVVEAPEATEVVEAPEEPQEEEREISEEEIAAAGGLGSGKVDRSELEAMVAARLGQEEPEGTGSIFCVVSKTGTLIGVTEEEEAAVELCEEANIPNSKVIRVRLGVRIDPNKIGARFIRAKNRSASGNHQLPTQAERRANRAAEAVAAAAPAHVDAGALAAEVAALSEQMKAAGLQKIQSLPDGQ